jgi:hypothetical protein
MTDTDTKAEADAEPTSGSGRIARRDPGYHSPLARVLLFGWAIFGIWHVADQWPMGPTTLVLLGVAIAMMLVMSLFEVRFA